MAFKGMRVCRYALKGMRVSGVLGTFGALGP